MKRIILIIIVCLFSLLSFRPKLEVKMGELTGVGSRFKISNLAGFVHPKGQIMKEDCSEIVIKNSNDPKISDVVSVTVNGEEIESSEFIGIIVQSL